MRRRSIGTIVLAGMPIPAEARRRLAAAIPDCSRAGVDGQLRRGSGESPGLLLESAPDVVLGRQTLRPSLSPALAGLFLENSRQQIFLKRLAS